MDVTAMRDPPCPEGKKRAVRPEQVGMGGRGTHRFSDWSRTNSHGQTTRRAINCSPSQTAAVAQYAVIIDTVTC